MVFIRRAIILLIFKFNGGKKKWLMLKDMRELFYG